MTKEELRKSQLKARRLLSQTEVNLRSEQILAQLKTLDIWTKNCFHTFVPIERNKEVNTWPLIHYLRDDLVKEVVVPKTNFHDFSMENIRFDTGTELYKNKFGIFEPVRGIIVNEQDVEVVFVPLLAFSPDGHRVGYGKGFYDRFLAKCSKDVIKIGLSIFDESFDIQNIKSSDVRLDYCVSPNKIITFT
ncbi:MAG: 5-formyltetrahydrofolate cyclo-ligase [Flavobacteriales bacterium]